VATTLTEGWYVDGVRLDRYAVVDDDNGVSLDDRAGWDDIPGLRGENVTLLGRHGDLWRRKKYGPGRKTLNLTVHGTTGVDGWTVPATSRLQRAAYEANLDALLRLFAPRHRLLSVERVHANGDRRQADCEVTSVIAPEPVGMTAGRISVELAVPGSFWEDVDATSYRVAFDVAVGGSQDLEVYSLAGQTAPCADPVVVVTGPCTSVAVHDTDTGSGWTYSSAIGAGDTLTVDAGEFTAVLDDGSPASVITGLVLADQQLLEVVPAPATDRGPEVTVTAAGVSSGFTVVFTTRRKWLR
jgi:hypothetical protein